MKPIKRAYNDFGRKRRIGFRGSGWAFTRTTRLLGGFRRDGSGAAAAAARNRETDHGVTELENREGKKGIQEGGDRVGDEERKGQAEEREEENRVHMVVEARRVGRENVDGLGDWDDFSRER